MIVTTMATVTDMTKENRNGNRSETENDMNNSKTDTKKAKGMCPSVAYIHGDRLACINVCSYGKI